MKRISTTAFCFFLSFSVFFSTLSFADTNKSTDLVLWKEHNPSLDLCRSAYKDGKSKGIGKVELEPTPSEEYVDDPFFTDLAYTFYYWNYAKRALVAVTTYGPLFFVPVTIRHYMMGVAGGVGPGGVAGAGAGAPTYWESMRAVAAFLSTSYTFANGLSEPIQGFINAFKSGVDHGFKKLFAWATGTKLPEIWIPEIAIKALELKYAAIKDTIPEKSHQIAIEDHLQKLTAQHVDHTVTRVNLLPTKDDGLRKSISMSLKTVERIMSIPHAMKAVKVNESILNELVSNYSEGTRTKLKNYANAIAYWSKPIKEKAVRPFREVLYLQGPSGTGKTFFAERFADIFASLDGSTEGLPIIKISLEDVMDLKDLIGQPTAGRFDEVERRVSKLSRILTSLAVEKRFKNAIIVLDEADKFLNSEKSAEIRSFFTKEIFNLTTKKLKLHDLGVEVDISNYHFILIGNTPIYDPSNAFMDRMTVVKFGAFAEDKRIRIACGEFGRGMSQLEHVQATDAHLKLILEGVRKDQLQKPGIRTLLRTVGEFIDHLSNPENKNVTFPLIARLESNAHNYSDPYGFYEMTMQKVEREYETLHPSIQKAVTEHLSTIQGRLLNEALRPNNVEDKKVLENYLTNINAMMSFPNTVRNLKDEEDKIMSNLDKLLRLYPDNVRKKIRDVVRLHISGSQEKNVVYFWGEPGTGKSYLAQGLAKALNLSLVEIDFKAGKFSELFGEGYFDFQYYTPSKLSRFTQTFLNLEGRSTEKNAVVYINEIDKILNNKKGTESENLKTMMLDILDPDKGDFLLRDLRASLDLSQYLFILVGNDKIETDSKVSALDDRMTLIEFKGFGLESKQEIAAKYFANIMKAKSFKVRNEDREVVQSIIEYSHVDKQQVSLRKPFRIIQLYVDWLEKKEGSFDYKEKLDQ